MITEREHIVAELGALLRDIPAASLPTSEVYAIPSEVTWAAAVHLAACGVRVVGPSDRRWVPPEHGQEHWVNPGRWEPVDPEPPTRLEEVHLDDLA